MGIDVTCPQCKEVAMSKIKKVVAPGIMLVCKSCQAEIAIQRTFSAINIVALVAGGALIKFFPESVLFWLGWVVMFVGCSYHLATVPLKIVKAGPNHAKYNS